jgi:DNA-binding NtrC family response regulator
LDWPGNVRQLENVCHWIAVMAPSPEIPLDGLPPQNCFGRKGTGRMWRKIRIGRKACSSGLKAN